MTAATAIILAAGRGSRMGEMTAAEPKCLTRLGGRRLLDWQRAALSDAGVSRVVVVGGYRAECLRNEGCDVIENPRWADTNMVASLLCARKVLLSEACVVVYSDIAFHADILRTLLRDEHPIAITYDRCWASLWRERFADPLQDAETFRLEGNRLVNIGDRPAGMSDVQGQYMGLLQFSPGGWREVEACLAGMPPSDIDLLHMTSLLNRLLRRGVEIAALPVNGSWCEVDRAEDLEVYEAAIASVDAGKRSWIHDWRGIPGS